MILQMTMDSTVVQVMIKLRPNKASTVGSGEGCPFPSGEGSGKGAVPLLRKCFSFQSAVVVF